MDSIIRTTRSLCPKCLNNLPAHMVKSADGQIYLRKKCPEHGEFSSLIWEGKVDFGRWTESAQPIKNNTGLSCPDNCGLCDEHESGSCCVLLEVTKCCNLKCSFCFAGGGETESTPSVESIKASILDIVQKCGRPLLQLSGGEPTLRDDLPDLIGMAKEAGCSYVQLNTNGLRLAEDPAYARTLVDAGLDIVFLQFDGMHDEIYKTLRGRALLRLKQKAVEVCSQLNIGVTLVVTVVPGVNDKELGEIIYYAAKRMPAIRAVHFQPVSYFGRYPHSPEENDRYTLDRLMWDISNQTEIPIDSFMPSRCDHPLCGFHSSFMVCPDGSLKPLSSNTRVVKGRGSAEENREYIARRWRRCAGNDAKLTFDDEMDFDTFLYRVRHNSLSISAMAFQDAGNMNIERLRRCSLHVYRDGKLLPFCANYLNQIK